MGNLRIFLKTDIKDAYLKGRKDVSVMHWVILGSPEINFWIKIKTLKKHEQLSKDINNKIF